jgi:hypothetical protein
MDLISRKHDLINFLTNGVEEFHFTNGLHGQQLGFYSYNDFLNYQKWIIDQFNETSISTLEFIRDTIVPNSRVLDRPTMDIYNIAGFVFDIDGKIVFYNPRQ